MSRFKKAKYTLKAVINKIGEGIICQILIFTPFQASFSSSTLNKHLINKVVLNKICIYTIPRLAVTKKRGYNRNLVAWQMFPEKICFI